MKYPLLALAIIWKFMALGSGPSCAGSAIRKRSCTGTPWTSTAGCYCAGTALAVRILYSAVRSECALPPPEELADSFTASATVPNRFEGSVRSELFVSFVDWSPLPVTFVQDAASDCLWWSKDS